MLFLHMIRVITGWSYGIEVFFRRYGVKSAETQDGLRFDLSIIWLVCRTFLFVISSKPSFWFVNLLLLFSANWKKKFKRCPTSHTAVLLQLKCVDIPYGVLTKWSLGIFYFLLICHEKLQKFGKFEPRPFLLKKNNCSFKAHEVWRLNWREDVDSIDLCRALHIEELYW